MRQILSTFVDLNLILLLSLTLNKHNLNSSLNVTDDSVLLKFGICKKNIEYILAQTSEEGNQKEMCQLKRRLYPMMYKCIPDNFEKRKTDCWENMLVSI